MVRAKGQCLAQFALPLFRRLVRPGVNQVDIDACKMLLRNRQSIEAFGNAMCSSQKSERCVVQGLKPQRNAVDPGFCQVCKTRSFDG